MDMNLNENIPNSKYIESVLKHAKEHPEKWEATWNAAHASDWYKSRESTRHLAWQTAWDLVRQNKMFLIWDTATERVDYKIRQSVCGTILALLAWEDSGELLEKDPVTIQLMSVMGHHAAILLYPSRLAMHDWIHSSKLLVNNGLD
jgi:hypothetical protein